MPEPNPIWGLHVAPGALAGALVRRTGEDLEILDSFVDDAPTASEALQRFVADSTRRAGVAGRPSLTAVPDHELAVGTGRIPSDELYLNDEEVYHHLHDFAPFEPGEGQLVYRPVGPRDARQYAVAAIPERVQASLDAQADALDERLHGIGLATVALVRGARALGMVDGRTFLVDVQATQTVVVAVDGESERRYLLASGLERCARSMDEAELLAADVLRCIAYHDELALRRSKDEDDAADGAGPADGSTRDVVLVGPRAPRARSLLGDRLAARLRPWDARAERRTRVTDGEGTELDDETAHVYAGSIGAALEAFRDPAERLVLRHPPVDVPAAAVADPAAGSPGRPGGLRISLAVVALVAAGAVAWSALRPGEVSIEERMVGGTGPGDNGTAPSPESIARARAEREREAREAEAALRLEREADRARAALGERARRVAHGRAVAAACAAVASAAPPHAPLAFEREEVRGTLRYTLLLDVAGSITPEVRREARAAVEGVPDVTHVRIDVDAGALRVRFRSAVAPRPEPGPGARTEHARLRAPEDAAGAGDAPPVLERDGDGRPILSFERARALLAPAADGVPIVLTPAEHAFADELLGAADAVLQVLPELAQDARAVVATAVDDGGRVQLEVDPPPAVPLALERRRLPDGAWEPAVEVPGGERLAIDHVAGPGGRYAWRAADGDGAVVAEVDVPIPVSVTLLGATEDGAGARLRLSRAWRGGTVSAEVEVRTGDERVRAEADGVTLDPGLQTFAIETRSETESVVERVPEFRPDGRVRRDDAGEPVLVERTIERSHDVLEVRALDAEGAVRTWVRKMTDG